MIELRTLGGLTLRAGDGTDLRSVLAQPKRLALLAYLALARPRGFHRRDTLLALFWPEQDEQHARWALNQSLTFLRDALGTDVLVGRGEGEVGVDPTRLRCDAVELEEAAERGDLEAALELYRGDLLEGFLISGAPGFERWLDGERARLRERAASVAWGLAEREEAAGRRERAASWARRALSISPYDEAGLRRLLLLLEAVGDRAQAIAEYERFARRLRDELEVEPSAETVAVVETIRQSRVVPDATTASGRTQESGVVTAGAASAGASEPGAVRAVAKGGARPWHLRRWATRRAAVLVVILLASGAVAVGGTVWRLKSRPAAAASPSVLAVLPFSYRGSPQFEYLREGMVDLLSVRLDGEGGLRSVDPRAVLSFAGRGEASANPDQGRRAAETFGAGWFVLGSVVEAGGRLQVGASIYDSEGRTAGSIQEVAQTEAEIFEVVDRLAARILAETQGAQRTTPVADLATSSLAALKAYLEGERELEAGRRNDAVEAFRRATAIDTSFALAYYRMAIAAFWVQLDVAEDALALAGRHAERLSLRHRRLVEAFEAFVEGDAVEADRLYRRIVADYPEDPESWFWLGEVIVHCGPLLGYSLHDAREPLERALTFRHPHAPLHILLHLLHIAAREGDRAEVDSLTDRFLALNPTDWFAWWARGQRAVLRGDTAELALLIEEVRRRNDKSGQELAGFVMWTTWDLVEGRRLWRLIAEPQRPRGQRVLAHATLAQFELANGRLRAADSELGAARRLHAPTALEYRALFALPWFFRTPRERLAALRDSLLRWDPLPESADQEGPIGPHAPFHKHFRLYLLGRLSVGLGDETAALGYAAALERLGPSSLAPLYVADLARVVRVEVARARGDTEEALRLLEGAAYWRRFDHATNPGDSEFFNRAYEHFLHAELLSELGRDEEALRWYRAIYPLIIYSAPISLRSAQLLERMGRHGEAAEEYARFIELWRDGDPELRPLVEEARARRSRLAAR